MQDIIQSIRDDLKVLMENSEANIEDVSRLRKTVERYRAKIKSLEADLVRLNDVIAARDDTIQEMRMEHSRYTEAAYDRGFDVGYDAGFDAADGRIS